MLSAMTSGIRNNWMKAIRLVMDLQHGNSNKNASIDSDSSASHSTADDLEVSTMMSSGRQSVSSLDSRSGSESPRQTARKDMRSVRRHYSDVSPGNVGKMLSIKDTIPGLDLEAINVPPTTVGMVRNVPAKPSEDQFDSGTVPDSAISKGTGVGAASEPYLSSSSVSSLSRYVEGSDNVALSGPPQSTEQKRSESKKEEEERRRRAKSPSARVKEKTRSNSPRLSSPHRKAEEDTELQLSVHESTDSKYDADDRRDSLPYADTDQDTSTQVLVIVKYLLLLM